MVIIGLLGALPLVGFLFNIVGWLAGICFFVGIILSILNFLKVLKQAFFAKGTAGASADASVFCYVRLFRRIK